MRYEAEVININLRSNSKEKLTMSDIIFWTIVVLSGAMSYSIGANDAANALGTSYGSNAARLWILLGLGAIFEFVGAVWCSSKVAGTLANKLIPELETAPADV
jgi:inorganic phosphate transporter, PiT family